MKTAIVIGALLGTTLVIGLLKTVMVVSVVVVSLGLGYSILSRF